MLLLKDKARFLTFIIKIKSIMIKKILKTLGILVLIIVIALFAIPFFFQKQINAKIVAAINDKIDAKISFEKADLSLFSNFPNANINIGELLILNKAPFAGDTLISLGELNLKMSIKELFKPDNESIHIDGITSKNGFINIIFNKDGVGNFDIALKDNDSATNSKRKPLALKIQEYKIENFKFKYFDEKAKIKMKIENLDHSGRGDFAASKLDLITKSTAKISLDLDKINYMDRVALTLDAVLGIDLEKKTYTFKNNKALVNQLPLEFDGSIQLLDVGQQYDLTFKTPTSSFQNFLGLVPSSFSGNIKDIKTTGDFSVAGSAKGIYSDATVPKFNLAIASNNASFQYPNLPKSVQNIVLDTKIINETGILNDTYINVDKLSFKIDQDVFEAKANIKNITVNPLIAAVLKGTLNLANLSKAYPINIKTPLTGILNADVTSNFDMKSIKTGQYQNIKNAGAMRLSQFKYVDEKNKALNISQATIVFNPSRVNLQQFNATTGKTDLNVTGTLDNFYGFIFNKQELKGNFNLQSKQFAVSDFVTAETADEKSNATKQGLKIPAFLNCIITAKIDAVLYDNLTLKNASGKMYIKDQKATFENIKTSIFNGLISANGSVSTKDKIPVFNMVLGLNQVDIQQTFTQSEMLKNIAPIASIINGKLNSTIKINGKLDPKAMTPDFKTLTGDLFGQMLSTTINASNSTVLNSLEGAIKFIDLKKLNLNDLKTNLTFKDGKVNIKPFDLKYKDIKINVGGSHGFDQIMNYNIKLDVPAKYLGAEVNALFAKLSPSETAKLENIPINALLTGNFSNPVITTDMKSAISNLAAQLVKQQKDKIIRQGTSALGNLLNDTKKDSTKNSDVKTKAGELLNGLFNKKKKQE